jgi:hypothetical protein
VELAAGILTNLFLVFGCTRKIKKLIQINRAKIKQKAAEIFLREGIGIILIILKINFQINMKKIYK